MRLNVGLSLFFVDVLSFHVYTHIQIQMEFLVLSSRVTNLSNYIICDDSANPIIPMLFISKIKRHKQKKPEWSVFWTHAQADIDIHIAKWLNKYSKISDGNDNGDNNCDEEIEILETWHGSCKSRIYTAIINRSEWFNLKKINHNIDSTVNERTNETNTHLVSHAIRMLFGIICNPNVILFNRDDFVFNCKWLLDILLCRAFALAYRTHHSLAPFLSHSLSRSSLLLLSVPSVHPFRLSVWMREPSQLVSIYKQSIDLWSDFFILSMRDYKLCERCTLSR